MASTRENTTSREPTNDAYLSLYDEQSETGSTESPASESSHTPDSASVFSSQYSEGEDGNFGGQSGHENPEYEEYMHYMDLGYFEESGSSGGSEEDADQSRMEDFEEKEAAQKEAVSDLGTVDMLNSGFFDKAGKVIDALVPDVGDTGKLKLLVNVPVDPTNTVKAGLAFEASVSRTNKAVKMKVQTAANVSAKQKVDAYFFAVEAFAKANLSGMIEASGDDGAEAFHLIGLAIHQQIKDVSGSLADAIFTGTFIQDTIDDMDEDDYVDVSLSGSLSAGMGGDVADNLSAKAEAATAAKVKKRLSKGEDGELKSETSTSVDNSVSVSLAASADPFKVTGKLQPKWKGTTFDKLSASLTGEASLDVAEMSDLVKKGVWIGSLVENLAKMIKGTSGMLSGDPARQTGSMAKFVASSSNMQAGLDGMTESALSEWDYFKGMTLKYRLTVSSDFNASGGSLSVKLDRISTISMGSSDDDALISVLLENTQNVFEWKA